jgi:hypothetical protein
MGEEFRTAFEFGIEEAVLLESRRGFPNNHTFESVATYVANERVARASESPTPKHTQIAAKQLLKSQQQLYTML